jgi:hypothetical protein
MTHKEREAEADRLMAILQGDGDSTLITETGELQTSADDDDPDDLAPFWAACPTCREQRMDFLDLDLEDGEWTVCLTCRTVFALEYSHL